MYIHLELIIESFSLVLCDSRCSFDGINIQHLSLVSRKKVGVVQPPGCMGYGEQQPHAGGATNDPST